MFYCEPCRIERDWPEAMLISYGNCEICEKSTRCYDRPSITLPSPKPYRGTKDELGKLIQQKAMERVYE